MALTTIVNQEDKAMDAKNQILAKKANRQKPSNQANQLASFNTQVLGGKDKMRPTPSLVPFTTEVVNGGNNRRPISNQAPVDQILAKPQSPAEQADLLAPYDTEIIAGKGNPLTSNMMPTSNLQTPTQQVQQPALDTAQRVSRNDQLKQNRNMSFGEALSSGFSKLRDYYSPGSGFTQANHPQNPFMEGGTRGEDNANAAETINDFVIGKPPASPAVQDDVDYDTNVTQIDPNVALARDAKVNAEMNAADTENYDEAITSSYPFDPNHITDFTDEMMKVEPPKTIFDTSGGAMVPDSKVTPGAKDYIATPDGWRLKEEVMPAGNAFGPQNIQDYLDKTGYISDADPKMVKRRAEAQAVHDNRVALNNEQARDREIMESKRNATFGSTGSVAGSTLGVNPNRVVNSNNARREAARDIKNKKADAAATNAAANMFNARVNQQKAANERFGTVTQAETERMKNKTVQAGQDKTEALKNKELDLEGMMANLTDDTTRRGQNFNAELGKLKLDENARQANLVDRQQRNKDKANAALLKLKQDAENAKNASERIKYEREYETELMKNRSEREKMLIQGYVDGGGNITDMGDLDTWLQMWDTRMFGDAQ